LFSKLLELSKLTVFARPGLLDDSVLILPRLELDVFEKEEAPEFEFYPLIDEPLF
jgi:hypothetical protein